MRESQKHQQGLLSVFERVAGQVDAWLSGGRLSECVHACVEAWCIKHMLLCDACALAQGMPHAACASLTSCGRANTAAGVHRHAGQDLVATGLAPSPPHPTCVTSCMLLSTRYFFVSRAILTACRSYARAAGKEIHMHCQVVARAGSYRHDPSVLPV